RWRFDIARHLERLGQLGQVGPGRLDLPCRPEALECAGVGNRGEDGYRAPVVGDLDRLAVLHQTEQLARPLPQLPHSYRHHVLLLAHRMASVSARWRVTPG